MARPSKNTDLKLIEAGRRLLPQTGVSDLSLRQVAEEAKVNLGMFHYHFGSKDEFVRQVLQQIYEELFIQLEREFTEGATLRKPLERLRSLLLILGRFAFQNRLMLASIIRDILGGEKVVREFLIENFPRHISLMHQAVVDCQSRGLIREDLKVPQILVLCASSLVASSVMATALDRVNPDLLKGAVREEFFSEELIEARIDFILRGLRP